MSNRFAVSLCASALAAFGLAAGVVASAPARAEDEAPAAAPPIYKWVDENGVAHYTTDRDRIPSEIGTRVERVQEPAATTTAAPHREDLMRDAVKTPPPATVVAPAPALPPAPVAAAPQPAAPTASPTDVEEVVDVESTEPSAEVEAVEESVEENATAPAPLATDADPEIDPVSAPPPAPVAALEPKQAAELAKLDEEIVSVEGQINVREEKLAALISSSEDERGAALVDDPSFREISQQLPKLQAELQSLRDRRNKIQPAAPTQ